MDSHAVEYARAATLRLTLFSFRLHQIVTIGGSVFVHLQGLGTVLSALSSGKQKSLPPPAIVVVREGEYQIPSVVVG